MSQTSPHVMLVGLGHAGIKIVQTAASQFPAASYSYLGIDTAEATASQEAMNAQMGRQPECQLLPMEAAWEAKLPDLFKDKEMIMAVIGLGGKTGCEAVKSFLAATAVSSVPLIVLATLPFDFEGEQRKTAALRSLASLRQNANATIVLPNSTLFATLPEGITAIAAFEQSDAWVAEVAMSILKPFTFNSLFNVRKENLEWLLKRKNATVSAGIGWGEGDDAIAEAVQQMTNSPFLMPMQPTDQADAALVMVTLPEDALYTEFADCLTAVKQLFSPNIKLEIGACLDETLAEGVRIVALMRYQHRPASASVPQASAASAATPPTGSQETAADSEAGHQLMLPMTDYSTGIFDKNHPTKFNLENLDIPTYLRRGITLEEPQDTP